MRIISLLTGLSGLLATLAASAHSVGGVEHGPMLIHWHVGETGLVLGVPASWLGIAMLAAAVIGLAGVWRLAVQRRSHRAIVGVAGASAALAFVGGGLLVGLV